MSLDAVGYDVYAQQAGIQGEIDRQATALQARMTRTSFGFSLGKFGLSYESLSPAKTDRIGEIGRINKADEASNFAVELEAAMQVESGRTHKTNYAASALPGYGVRAYEAVAAMAWEEIPKAVGGTIGYV